MRSAADGQASLAAALAARGGDLADALTGGPAPDGDGAPGPAQLAAAGPRAAGREDEYELLVEMILEGARLHYGRPRVVGTDDPDLALLLGDQLYALGLARLAELGDLDAVAELADLISLVAVAEAADEGDLTEAVWIAGARAIGWGSNPRHEQAKQLARERAPEAPAALLAAAGSAAS